MGRLYKRKAVLELIRPINVESLKPLNEESFNTIIIEDLRLRFSVTKSLEKTPNTSTIEVTNLAEQTRSFVQIKPLHVRLNVGYENTALTRLAVGDIIFATSRLMPPEWNTEIQIGDGARVYKFGRINTTLHRPSIDQVLQTIANAMEISVPSNINSELLTPRFDRSVSLFGAAQIELTRLLDKINLFWSIQDGQLQILGPEEVQSGQVIEISQDTGMIGSPEIGAPIEAGKPPILNVTTLLEPRITPGRLIVVDSKVTQGTFRVERVTHTGDTRGPQWDSQIEAKPI